MISKKYNLYSPADVRRLIADASADSNLGLLLHLIYRLNSVAGKGGYTLKQMRQAAKKGDAAGVQHYAQALAQEHLERARYGSMVKGVARSMGVTCERQLGGRVRRVVNRVTTRGQARPPGYISGLSQKALFLFSDLYTDEALQAITINNIMFSDGDDSEQQASDS